MIHQKIQKIHKYILVFSGVNRDYPFNVVNVFNNTLTLKCWNIFIQNSLKLGLTTATHDFK